MAGDAAGQQRFVPPTAEQVAEHVAEHAPKTLPPWLRFVPLGVIGAAVLVSLASPSGWSLLLPWVALLGVLLFGITRRRLRMRHTQLAQRTQELAMLRNYRPALRRAWTLLPKLRTLPDEHGRVVAVIGHVLEDLGHHEAGNAAFAHLIEGLPDQHPAGLSLRIQQAIGSFQSEHLADGDAQLRKVRNLIGPFEDGTLGAAYHTARLVQSVYTNHFEEGVEEIGDPVARFRTLGVDGGVGHALLAYCLHRLGRRNEAKTAWRRATLLLPAEELVRRIPLLRELNGAAA